MIILSVYLSSSLAQALLNSLSSKFSAEHLWYFNLDLNLDQNRPLHTHPIPCPRRGHPVAEVMVLPRIITIKFAQVFKWTQPLFVVIFVDQAAYSAVILLFQTETSV